jgi:tetratricopeptide (TPR) repeat protein
MKRMWTAKKKEHSGSVNLLCLLFLPLLVSGCSSHDNRFTYFNMLDGEKRTAQNKQAAEKFWSSIRPVSTLSASHYKLGRYYQQQGKYEKAIGEFSKAVHNDSSYCKAYNGIAMSHDALNRCDMASHAYEQAIQCTPQEAYVKNNYACSSILCGDYDKGLALLLEAAQLSKDNSRIKNNIQLAQTLVERENKLAKPTPQGGTAELIAKTDEEPVENEVHNSPTVPVYEKAGNSPPEGTAIGDVVNSRTVENTVKYSAGSPVQVSDLADKTAARGMTEEMVILPGQDADTVSKEVELEPPSHSHIMIACLVAEQAQRISAGDQTKPAINYTSGAIEVSNGNGITGMASRSADFFHYYGFSIGRITNAEYFHFHDSTIFYREGYLQMAEELARITPGIQTIKKVDSLGRSSIGVRILLGRDLAKIQFPEGYAHNFSYSQSTTADYISSISNRDKLSGSY